MTNQQLIEEINTLLAKADFGDTRIEVQNDLTPPSLVTLRLYRNGHYRVASTIELKPGQRWEAGTK